MKGIKHLVLIFALAAGACGGAQKAGGGVANPAEIEQNIEKNCQADKLPIGTPEQKASFTDMIGKVVSGLLTKVDFVNQLVAQNPGSEQAVKCAADHIPESPTPPPAGDQPPPK
jgi:hypothetical protein